MSNTNNQLDLFQGVLLTVEQEQEVYSWIARQSTNAVKRQEELNRTMLMLDEAGFVQGRDYDSNFEIYEVTQEREFGYSYNNTQFEKEVTYMNAVGNVYLITNYIKDGEMRKYKASISREGNKIMCTTITEQYRYYKPSSLYVKLYEFNESQTNKLARLNRESVAMKNVIEKFQKQYPEASVTEGTDYYRRSYQSFPIVTVKFASGSTVSFTLGYGNDLENVRFHKKYDAVSESAEALMERFNNQKAK